MLIKGTAELPPLTGAILLIQLGDIGDVVLTLPTIDALHAHFPEKPLVVCVRGKARQLLDAHPHVSVVLPVKKHTQPLFRRMVDQLAFIRRLRRCRVEMAIDLREGDRGALLALSSGATVRIGRVVGGPRHWRNRVFTHLVRPENEHSLYVAQHHLNVIAHFGWHGTDAIPRLPVNGARRRAAQAILEGQGVPPDKPLVAVQPLSPRTYKVWPLERCAEMIDHIKSSTDASVAIMGAADQRRQAAEVITRCRYPVFNLAGKSSIGELVGILDRADLFIGIDTADLHIAAAVNTPTVGIFGPTAPVSWAPRGEGHRVVTSQMECVPCRQKGCDHSGISRCLDTLLFDDVRDCLDAAIAAHVN